MRCGKCNAELDSESKFCPVCGTRVENREELKRESELKELENQEQKAKALVDKVKEMFGLWKKRRDEAIEKEKRLQFRIDNLKMMVQGKYPGLKKYVSEASTESFSEKGRNSVKTPWIVILVLSVISLVTLFMPWFAMPVFGGFFDRNGITPNLIDGLRVFCDTAELFKTISVFHKVIVGTCIAALAIPLFYAAFIWAFIKKEDDSVLRDRAFRSSRYGMIASGAVILEMFILNALFISEEGSYYGGYTYVSASIGAWLALLLAIAVFVITRSMASENKASNVNAGESLADLEVVNYDPALLFRPIRIHLSQLAGLSMRMEAADFEYPAVNRAEAEIQLFYQNGQKVILPETTFTPAFQKGEMEGMLRQYRVRMDGLREARVFVKECRVGEKIYKGSSLYADSDYSVELLKNMRSRNGNIVFKEIREYEEYRMCACGQLYKKELTECPLCGRKILTGSEKVNG